MLVAETNQVDNTTKTAAYADDLNAAGTITRLRKEILCKLEPTCGEYPKGIACTHSPLPPPFLLGS